MIYFSKIQMNFLNKEKKIIILTKSQPRLKIILIYVLKNVKKIK